MSLESERSELRARDFDRPANATGPPEIKRGRPVAYLRNLTPARTILWCYAIWYLLILVRYFDPSPRIWFTALGLSGIVGLALLVSTRASLAPGARIDNWGVFRLFLMPFCVSSFAALLKGRGFILIFPPSWQENLFGIAAAATFVALTLVLRKR